MLTFIDSKPERTQDSSVGDYIAVDANPYRIRMIHAASDGFIMATFESKAHELERSLRFVRRQKKRGCESIRIVGARHDRWPTGLLAALVQEFGPINWIPLHVFSQTAHEYRMATHLAKFVRATYLAACAHRSTEPTVTLEGWKRMLLFEVACGLGLPTYLDDIPF